MPCESPARSVVDYIPDCTPDLLDETIDILDRWSKRTEAHVSKQRARPRFNYRGTVTIASPIAFSSGAATESDPTAVFHVTARNISQGGVGLIVPPTFVPAQMSDATPLIFSEALFRIGLRVTITIEGAGVRLGPVDALIVRQRRVHHEFLELGLKFLEKHDSTPTVDALPSVAESTDRASVLNQ